MRRQNLFRLIVCLSLAIGVLTFGPSTANAQARGGGHVAVGVGGGYYGGHVIVGGHYGYGYPYYRYGYYPYYPHFYFGFYYPFYSPWYYGAGWYYPYGYPYPYGPYGYGYPDPTASVRLEITPKNAEVYVDGYRAGTVNDYDGFFQRLRVPPGSHDIVLYLDGYRTVHQQLNLSTGSDQKIQYAMVALQPGEQAEPRPNPPPQREPNQNEPQYPPGYPQPDVRRAPSQAPPHVPAPAPAPVEPNAGEEARYGSVSIRVQPIDAQVVIDGDEWSSSRPEERLVVELSPGRHHVEIQKDGFQKYSNDIQIRGGETVSLNVSLLKR